MYLVDSMGRYKPTGWRGESHRHYLASKGITTRKYLVRNELKGNRESGIVKSLQAQGVSKQEAVAAGILPASVLMSRRRQKLVDASQLSIPEIQSPIQAEVGNVAFAPLPEEPVPMVESPAPMSRPTIVVPPEVPPTPVEPLQRLEEPMPQEPTTTSESPVAQSVQGNVVLTPGVPERTPFGFGL